ncbi:hypothetical protein SteCoe_3263 [Stentor coeruleus]|uniref:Uncharacterized protein n=1 Tax=Stentor coeruleus TaxID=5963 RepID=A0A1R2CXG1_9CILI|nr:hypothetical protein SteCoe_3263 [Stentor coeruleus]
MNSHKRQLSIDTDFSMPSGITSTVTTTTHITITSEESLISSIHSSNSSEVDQSIKEMYIQNNKMANTNQGRFEAYHAMKNELEILKLKKDMKILKNSVQQLENLFNKDKFPNNFDTLVNCSSVASHKLLLLKDKLKEAKKKNKEMKIQRDFVKCENSKLKTILIGKPPLPSQNGNNCSIF